MSDDEREKWDTRYATGDYTPRRHPSPFLEEWLPRLPVGRALDVACGTGRNALRLAEAGFEVHAVDISEVAIERARAEATRRGLDIEFEVTDLDEATLPEAAYDLITVFRYRNRSLWPRLAGALAPDGFLVIEHHLRTGADVDGPPTPEFRLEPQELLTDLFGSLRVVFYSEGLEAADRPGRTYAIARFVGCRGEPGF